MPPPWWQTIGCDFLDKRQFPYHQSSPGGTGAVLGIAIKSSLACRNMKGAVPREHDGKKRITVELTFRYIPLDVRYELRSYRTTFRIQSRERGIWGRGSEKEADGPNFTGEPWLRPGPTGTSSTITFPADHREDMTILQPGAAAPIYSTSSNGSSGNDHVLTILTHGSNVPIATHMQFCVSGGPTPSRSVPTRVHGRQTSCHFGLAMVVGAH